MGIGWLRFTIIYLDLEFRFEEDLIWHDLDFYLI